MVLASEPVVGSSASGAAPDVGPPSGRSTPTERLSEFVALDLGDAMGEAVGAFDPVADPIVKILTPRNASSFHASMDET